MSEPAYHLVITKSMATHSANSKYLAQVNVILKQMDELIKDQWAGHSLTLSLPGQKKLPDQLVRVIQTQMAVAGWTVSYQPPGWDQRDGDWPGQFTIS